MCNYFSGVIFQFIAVRRNRETGRDAYFGPRRDFPFRSRRSISCNDLERTSGQESSFVGIYSINRTHHKSIEIWKKGVCHFLARVSNSSQFLWIKPGNRAMDEIRMGEQAANNRSPHPVYSYRHYHRRSRGSRALVQMK